ncbi:hypothetical protein [Viridibacillus arvi]|uniref:hypothetical protein n=1 Tax=Viridibacillus arvi TaxID=263475 RepID=UPI0034CF8EB0
MNEEEQLEKLKKNIMGLEMAMIDAPYFGLNGDNIKGVRFAINKILKGTDINTESLIKEKNEKKWFQG